MTAVLLLLAALLWSQPERPPTDKLEKQARLWLTQLDRSDARALAEGMTARARASAGDIFSLTNRLSSQGRAVSRRFTSVHLRDACAVLRYDAMYLNGTDTYAAVEQVTVAADSDGLWRVSGFRLSAQKKGKLRTMVKFGQTQ